MSKKRKKGGARDKEMVKQDINLLEYPLWTVQERGRPLDVEIERDNGRYIVAVPKTADRLPDKIDNLILLSLLRRLYDNNFRSREIITSRYAIVYDVFDSPKEWYYERVLDGLARWVSVSVRFDGTFYEGDRYTTRIFGIIDDVKIDKKGKLVIRFNEEFLEQVKETSYYKLIDFNCIRRLKRPISLRLYEILIKNFVGRDTWKIGIMKLRKKLTIQEKYPCHILQKLKPAISEINKKTDIMIDFKYDKKRRVCTFKKLAWTNEQVEQVKKDRELKALMHRYNYTKNQAFEEHIKGISEEKYKGLVERFIREYTFVRRHKGRFLRRDIPESLITIFRSFAEKEGEFEYMPFEEFAQGEGYIVELKDGEYYIRGEIGSLFKEREGDGSPSLSGSKNDRGYPGR